MTTSRIDFINGIMFLHNLQHMLLPMNTFICMLNQINQNETQKQAQKILQSSTEIDATIIYERIMGHKTSNTEKIKQLIKIINSFGMGEICLKYQSKKKIFFTIPKPILYDFYKKLYKAPPKTIPEEIISGYLKVFVAKIFKKKTSSNVELDRNPKSITISITILDEDLKESKLKHHYEIPQKIIDETNVLKKVLINKHMVTKNGSLTLWKAYAILCPYFFLIELMRKLGKEYEKFFLMLGNMQGKAAIEIQKGIFGIPIDKLLVQVIEQTDLVGFGATKIIQKKPLIFKLENNLDTHFSKFYDKSDYNSIKLYTKGDIKGIFEYSFNLETELASNNNYDELKVIKQNRILNEKEKQIDKYINAKAIFTTTSLRQ